MHWAGLQPYGSTGTEASAVDGGRGELVLERLRLRDELVPAGRYWVREKGVRVAAAREHGRQAERRLPMVRCNPRHVDETGHGVVTSRGVGDDHATVGVPDTYHGFPDPGVHVEHARGSAGDAAQWVGDRDDLVQPTETAPEILVTTVLSW
jgi:hypothetical protein